MKQIFATFVVLALGMTLLPAFAQTASAAVTNPNPILTLTLYGPQALTKDVFIDVQHATANQNAAVGGLLLGEAGTLGSCGAAGGCSLLFQLNLTSITGAIPANAKITNSVLNLYMYQYVQATGVVRGWEAGARITSSWTETGVTWNTRPTTISYTDFPIAIQQDSIGAFVPFDITNMTSGWFSGFYTNNGAEFDWNAYEFLGQYVPKESTNLDLRPRLVIQYQLAVATIYPAYYCSGGPCETAIISGSGLPAYLFNVYYSENNGTLRRAIRPDIIPTNLTTWFRLQVKDFFNNILYDSNKSVNSWQMPWIVGIQYGIFEAYNMRDFITTLSIQPASGIVMLIDLVPRGWWVIPLRSSIKYWFNFTLLNGNMATVGTVSVSTTMGQKLTYIVNGTSLTQVVVNQNNQGLTINSTYGVTAGVGNVLLAPHGIDLFYAYYTLQIGASKVGISLWLILVLLTAIGGGIFVTTYREKLAQHIFQWPKRARLAFGYLLMPAASLLIVALIVYVSGGSVIIPIPWVPIPQK
jgi:hypothetical protein